MFVSAFTRVITSVESPLRISQSQQRHSTLHKTAVSSTKNNISPRKPVMQCFVIRGLTQSLLLQANKLTDWMRKLTGGEWLVNFDGLIYKTPLAEEGESCARVWRRMFEMRITGLWPTGDRCPPAMWNSWFGRHVLLYSSKFGRKSHLQTQEVFFTKVVGTGHHPRPKKPKCVPNYQNPNNKFPFSK